MEKRGSEVVIMLGGNTPGTRQLFDQTLVLLANEVGEIKKASHIYISEPWGGLKQADFLNQAVLLETELAPHQLLNTLLAIETKFGRERNVKNGPRTLDIDILYYKDLIINKLDLQVPHPRLHLRRFNLVPLQEVASNWEHPVFKLSVNELLEKCPDPLQVTKENSK